MTDKIHRKALSEGKWKRKTGANRRGSISGIAFPGKYKTRPPPENLPA